MSKNNLPKVIDDCDENYRLWLEATGGVKPGFFLVNPQHQGETKFWEGVDALVKGPPKTS